MKKPYFIAQIAKISLFPLVAFSTNAQELSDNTGTPNCLNTKSQPEYTPCVELRPAGAGDNSGGDNPSPEGGTLESSATDFSPSSGASGCGPCGGGGLSSGKELPSVGVTRLERLRSSVGIPGNLHGSFGAGQYWAEVDKSLRISENGLISILDPTLKSRLVIASLNPARAGWADLDTEYFYSLSLFDASGSPITSLADVKMARTATILHHNGGTDHYEFFWTRNEDVAYGNNVHGLNDARGHARLVARLDRNGNAITIDYERQVPADGFSSDASASDADKLDEFRRLWCKAKVTDAHNREILITNERQRNRYTVTSLLLPTTEVIDYSYKQLILHDSLESITHEDGSKSTWALTKTKTLNQITRNDLSSSRVSQRRVLFYSTTKASNGNGGFKKQGPHLIRRIDNQAGEPVYANQFITDSNKDVQSFTYYGGNKTLVYTFNPNSNGPENVQYVTDVDEFSDFNTLEIINNPTIPLVNQSYNSQRWMSKAADPFSREREYTRNPITHATLGEKYQDGSTKADSFNQFNQSLISTDRIGRKRLNTYDPLGNLLISKSALGTADETATENIYNTRGQIIEARDALYDSDYPDLHNTKYEYDSNNYLVKKIASADFAGGTRPVSTYTYDAAGRVISSTDPLGRTVLYTYDARSRVIETTYNDSSTELVEYGTGDKSNLVISRTDRNATKTTYDYDAANRLIETIVAPGLPEESITTYTYLSGTSKKLTSTRNGDTTTYNYDYANRLIGTTVKVDAETTLETSSEYDQIGRLRSSTDAYGRSTYYLYDQNDRRIKTVTETVPGALAAPDVVENSTQTSSSFTYTLTDLAGNTLETSDTHKVTYTDPRDLFLDNLQRDNSDNAAYLITETVYDSEGQRLISTDARGNSTWTEYDTLGRSTLTIVAVGTPSEIRSEQDYDNNSNVVESRSPRHFTEGSTITGVGKDQYTYNGRNLRATHTTAVGSDIEATQSWTYYLDGRADEATDFRGNVSKSFWHICCGRFQASLQQDGLSGSISNTDFNGNVTHTAVVSDLGASAANYHDPIDADTLAETTTRFDARGRPTHTTRWLQPLGEVLDEARANLNNGEIPIATDSTVGLTTTYTYDEDLTDGIGIDAEYSSQISDLAARYGYNPFGTGSNGYATAMTNPEGETSVQIQDGAGRTILTINPEGDISTMDYDEVVTLNVTNNDLTVNATLLATSSTDANGNTNTSYTDGAGRTLLTEDAIGNFAAMAYDANSNLGLSRDANGLGQNCDYDALNRYIACADLQEMTEGNTRTKTYNAASQVITSTNADGETITNVYDARSRMTSSTDGNDITTSYAYDANNNLITLTDGKGEDRQWFYDARNLATTKTYPSTSGNDFYTTSYDALGRPVIKTDQQGDTCTSIYDLASRMTQKEYRTGGTALESTDTFEYDAASRVTSTHKGRYDVTTAHTYALDSMPLTETLTADGRTYTSSRSYDLANRPLSHTFPSGEATTWTYDARNLVNTVAYDGDPVTTNTYDAGYRLTDQAFGNGLNREINYNRDDNLRSSDRVIGEDDLRLSYTYDADKQITAENIVGDVLPDTSFTASYDAGNRISSWNRANNNQLSNQTWNYDDAGNWNSTSKTVGTQTETENRDYNAADGITSIAGNTTVQDDKGNLTEFEINTKEYEVEYDLDNRINKVDVDGTEVSYRYDAMGRRVLRQEGSASSSTTAMIWWGNSECAEHKHTATQTVIQNDIMEHPSRLNSVIARAVDGSKNKLEWYHKNYLDHVYAVSDDSGDILEHYRYTAFGEVTIYNENGQIQSESQIDNDILWNTRRLDEVTGLYLYKYRHYSPELGRWLGRDPIEEWGGINLYAFVGNDGINEADYLGLFIWYTSELAAATSAGNKSKTMGEEWDADNSELVTKHNKQAMFKFSGMEYCGRICMKCYAADESLQNSSLPDEYKKTVYFYSYTGPVRGTLPSDVDAGNKKKFDAYQKKLEAFKERIKKYEEEYKTNNPGKAIPIPDWQPEPPEYAGASCQPLNAPPCSTLGEGWEDISYYHSHPSNNGFSEGDKNFAKALGKALWVTRGPRGKPGKWITEKTGG